MRMALVLAFAAGTLVALGCIEHPESGEENQDAAPAVHLYENHSSALIAWRRARERDRVLVHLDGHADLDWLPDETVARIAAAHPDELADLELHPYALDDHTLDRFAIWNFIYPAARMGLVREVVWVVPDGTLGQGALAGRLVREIVLAKMQMIGIQEAQEIHLAGGTIQGMLYGVPITICELSDLPDFGEPVLLDIDLDYFTTSSALTQAVTERPRIMPRKLLDILDRQGLRTDHVTLSMSTMGGYLPPGSRWLGNALSARLRSPSKELDVRDALRRRADEAERSGDLSRAEGFHRELVRTSPDDASSWYALARILGGLGRKAEAGQTRARAIALDSVLAHEDLFAGDRNWLNGNHAAALTFYRRYLDTFGDGPFAAYALRRVAGCLMRLDRVDEAISAFRRVVQAVPGHADSRIDLGVLLRERGGLDVALEEFRRARELQPDLATAAMALGSTYLLAGEVERGVAELEVAVVRKPCWAMAHGNLAAGLARMGRLKEAARHLSIARSLQPSNPQINRLASELRAHGVRMTAVSAPP